MKSVCIALPLALLGAFPAHSGGVPLAWTVDTARGASCRAFDQWAGAAYELEATVTSAGRPLVIDGEVALYYQTNGMGRLYWRQPAAASNNVIRAAWLPSYEAGAGVYSGFLGAPGKVWNAAFKLRLRPSPGASPNALALPAPRIDFAAVEVANAPWATDEGVEARIAAATDGLASAVYTRAQADARFYPAAEGESVWSFLTAENFSVVVTNYDSSANDPSLTYRYRISTNDPWRIVWTETNGLRRAVERATNLAARAAAELAAKPENRAWGLYDSQTGEAAPDGIVQVSAAGGLMIGGGVSWSQIEAGGGSYWLLTSTDPTVCATGTNGVLSIVGSDGEEAVRVVKGDRLTVPAPASGIAKTPGHVSVTYSVVSDAHPTAEFGRSPGGPWLRDGEEGSPVSFSWSGGSGAWQLDFDVSGGDDAAGFVRATYETGGGSYTAFGGGGVELGRIRVGGIPYIAGVSRIDGKTVLTLTPTDR